MSSRLSFLIFAVLISVLSNSCAPSQEVVQGAVQTALAATQESNPTSTSVPSPIETPFPTETPTFAATLEPTHTPTSTPTLQPTDTPFPTDTPAAAAALVGKWIEITGTGYIFDLHSDGRGSVTTNDGTFDIEWQVLDGAFCAGGASGLLCNEYWLVGDTLKINDLVYFRQ